MIYSIVLYTLHLTLILAAMQLNGTISLNCLLEGNRSSPQPLTKKHATGPGDVASWLNFLLLKVIVSSDGLA